MISITDKTDCCGCYACYNICPVQCITMKPDDEGFEYPETDTSKCIGCGKCNKVCPLINYTEETGETEAFAAYNKEESTRINSSSGGIFSALSEHLFSKGGVVFGASFDGDFDVRHAQARNADELSALRGSKYVQSTVGQALSHVKELLDEEVPVLFSGTPCQIAGLKGFLQRDYQNLFCADLICHGVSSPAVWCAYKNMIAEKHPFNQINFRDKSSGWRNYSLSFYNGNTVSFSEIWRNNFYMTGTMSNYFLRPSCHACRFKTVHRLSDITLADYWGISEVHPEMFDEKGVSLLLTHSEKGRSLLNEASSSIVCKNTGIDEAIQRNDNAVKSETPNPKRDEFFKDFRKMKTSRLFKKYFEKKLSIRVKTRIKKLLLK